MQVHYSYPSIYLWPNVQRINSVMHMLGELMPLAVPDYSESYWFIPGTVTAEDFD